MNFCVYLDSGAEVHGYFVPDGFSTTPRIHVRINCEDRVTELETWIYHEGARTLGAHQTGKVGFVLTDDNVAGIGKALSVELSDPDSGIVFYRRANGGEFLPKKVLRVETAYIPHSEIDLSLKNNFQFFEHRVEHYGFETIRQMLEIVHQPSVYVSGRILLKNFRMYIGYNIDTTMISLRDPFYEMASRMIVFSRISRRDFNFVSARDKTLFKETISWLDGLDVLSEAAVNKAIRAASKDAINSLSSPFTQQLTASSPSDIPNLSDVSQALDTLSQFTVFDASNDAFNYPRHISEVLGVPEETIHMRPQLEPIHRLADILRKSSRVEHILEADLLLYHFIQKAGERAARVE